jgi:hypothetical protein
LQTLAIGWRNDRVTVVSFSIAPGSAILLNDLVPAIHKVRIPHVEEKALFSMSNERECEHSAGDTITMDQEIAVCMISESSESIEIFGFAESSSFPSDYEERRRLFH